MAKRIFTVSLVPLLCTVGLWAGGAKAASVYRTTDAQGNVVFTDKPVDNAERIDLEPLTVVPSAQTRRRAAACRAGRLAGCRATLHALFDLPYRRTRR